MSDQPRPRADAVASADASSEQGDVELVVAEVDGSRFGFPLEHVLEVQRMVALTPLPGAPEIVEGVIDLRGRIVPVLDIRDRFGLRPHEPGPADQLLVALAAQRVVAIQVERTLGVHRIAVDDIDADNGGVPGVARVSGVARDADGLVLIHDLATFLSWGEVERLESALSESSRT